MKNKINETVRELLQNQIDCGIHTFSQILSLADDSKDCSIISLLTNSIDSFKVEGEYVKWKLAKKLKHKNVEKTYPHYLLNEAMWEINSLIENAEFNKNKKLLREIWEQLDIAKDFINSALSNIEKPDQ